jgi:hypothetical protein
MKNCLFIIVTWLFGITSSAQVLIHSHNDYQQPLPFTNAIQNKVFSLEADVYLVDSLLMVAHDKKDITGSNTLWNMYLQPFIALYIQHKGFVSTDKFYKPVLVIDIKENGTAVIAQLVQLLDKHRNVFDRSVNTAAVQVVLSGDRGPISKWSSYPAYILFDGRPYETYDSTTFQRVAFISDTYLNYFNKQDSIRNNNLLALVKKIHTSGKLLRVWGMPDDATSWQLEYNSGIDIINTNKVAECRDYFLKKKNK